MNTITTSILKDQSVLSENLSPEETIIAISCAYRVLDHLQRHLDRTGDHKYQANIDLIALMIENHQNALPNAKKWGKLKASA